MIYIDYKDRRPIYEQIIDRIEDLASRNALKADEQLPSVRQLAMELSINPNTIQRAYMELEKKNVIYSVKGKGNFVSPNLDRVRKEKQSNLLLEIRELFKKAAAIGISQDRLREELDECYRKAK
ncbi:MAG: GntR family transcriptional regulator, partial [Clostridiales bacterium]|nr:GntR family transcriptional regulator [Clostridiales bacterium]